ncbi:MAG: hypothetical protein ACJ0BR_06330 [Candidatus Puniceispirillales bacterium]
MDKEVKKIIKLVDDMDEKEKIKEICNYASETFDKVIILGMKKIDNKDDYKIIGNYKDIHEIVFNLECAKLSVLNQNH